jgi:ribose transport system permease protein
MSETTSIGKEPDARPDGRAVPNDAQHRVSSDTRRRLSSALSPRLIGAVYVLLAVVVVFAFWIPDLFLQPATFRQILNQSAIPGLVALSLLIPLAAGVFDLSVAATLGLTSILIAKILASTSLSLALAILITMGCALLIGLLNAFIVVVMRVDSFIGTLATSSLLSAAVVMTSDNTIISSVRLIGPIHKMASMGLGGITAPVFYLLGLGIILWFVTEQTALGRRIYASGFNQETARLSGIHVSRIKAASLVVSALIAGFAGILVTGQITTGSPTVGPSYLLPAYAMAFVGATQIHPGRFNSWGTLIAVLLIGTGSVGLALTTVPAWAPSVYLGIVLIIAISLTGMERRAGTSDASQ